MGCKGNSLKLRTNPNINDCFLTIGVSSKQAAVKRIYCAIAREINLWRSYIQRTSTSSRLKSSPNPNLMEFIPKPYHDVRGPWAKRFFVRLFQNANVDSGKGLLHAAEKFWVILGNPDMFGKKHLKITCLPYQLWNQSENYWHQGRLLRREAKEKSEATIISKVAF